MNKLSINSAYRIIVDFGTDWLYLSTFCTICAILSKKDEEIQNKVDNTKLL